VSAHPFTDEENRIGAAQAEAFIARILSGEPIAADELAQQLALARFGSCERQRAFASRIQAVLVARCRDAS